MCARFSRRPFTSSIGPPGVHAVSRLSLCYMPGSMRCDVTICRPRFLLVRRGVVPWRSGAGAGYVPMYFTSVEAC